MSAPRTPALPSVSNFHQLTPLSIETHPDFFTGQVGKVLGERWKALTPLQRKPYEDKALIDKERYEKQKAAYLVSPPAPVKMDDKPTITSTRPRRRNASPVV
jgi:hypothetical protein